jgi:hypothetical protein
MELIGKVGFNGSEISGFAVPIVSGSGTFIGELRRNSTTFGLEVWDGTSWKSNDGINTSKVQAIPAIMYYLIPNETGNAWIIAANEAGNERWFNDVNTCFSTVVAAAQANTSKRYKILIYPGTYNLMANISILNNMQVELMHGAEIASSGYSINMTNGAIIGSGVLNVNIIASGSLSILHGSYFKRITCSGTAMIKANILVELISSSDFADINLDVVKATDITIRGKMTIKAHHISYVNCLNTTMLPVFVQANNIVYIEYGFGIKVEANYIFTASVTNGQYSQTVANIIEVVDGLGRDMEIQAAKIGNLYCSPDRPVYNARLNVGYIQGAYLRGEVDITGNLVQSLLCFSQDDDLFDIKVNVNEIGDVRTMYGWTYDEFDDYNATPQAIADVNGVKLYCNCETSKNLIECVSGEICIMRPYLSGSLQAVPPTIDYVAIQQSRLSIIANKRTEYSVWFLAVGTITAIIQNFNCDSSSNAPHTYIASITPSSNSGNVETMTVLRLSDITERSYAIPGYQLSGHCALVLNNVNIHSDSYNVVRSSNNTARRSNCGIKNSCLKSSMPNIQNGPYIGLYTNIQNSYGNTGTNNTIPITGSGNLILNTTDNWM